MLIGATLGRYFAWRFVRTILGVFLTVFALVYTLDFVELLRRAGDAEGASPGLMAQLALYRTPAVAESVRRKDCRLAVGNLAALAGVSETTVRNAIREAVQLGLVTVEERRITGWRNDTNVVRIVSAEWTAWLRLTRKRKGEAPAPVSEGGGCKSAKGTPTDVLSLWIPRPKEPSQELPRSSGRLSTQRAVRNRRGR